jgi:hypothetical protein
MAPLWVPQHFCCLTQYSEIDCEERSTAVVGSCMTKNVFKQMQACSQAPASGFYKKGPPFYTGSVSE